MFRNDIDVIRAAHTDRMRRDIFERGRPEWVDRRSRISTIRRSIGAPMVIIGRWIAGDSATETNVPARSLP